MSNSIPLTCCLIVLAAISAQARSYANGPGSEDESLAVIPSPNEQHQELDDIRRVSVGSAKELHLAAPSETAVPVYVSPFFRPEKRTAAQPASGSLFDSSSESSQAPPNYAPKPLMAAEAAPSQRYPAARDLKTAASYGHHHHGGYEHHGYGPSGWLDMGAWTGGKGSFGWYADYPVGGGKHHYGHGRK